MSVQLSNVSDINCRIDDLSEEMDSLSGELQEESEKAQNVNQPNGNTNKTFRKSYNIQSVVHRQNSKLLALQIAIITERANKKH